MEIVSLNFIRRFLLSPKTLFSKNNYNTDFVRRNTQFSNTDSNTQNNVNSGPVTTATISVNQRHL